MAEESARVSEMLDGRAWRRVGRAHVKSPVASLCFACSSVRNRVRVTMSVLIDSVPVPTGGSPLVPLEPFAAILFKLVLQVRKEEAAVDSQVGYQGRMAVK